MSTHGSPQEPLPIRELIQRLTELDAATGVERARLARELGGTHGPLLPSVRAAGDEGMWQATREMSHGEVAQRLGVSSRGTIADAVARHNRRRRGIRPDDRSDDV